MKESIKNITISLMLTDGPYELQIPRLGKVEETLPEGNSGRFGEVKVHLEGVE